MPPPLHCKHCCLFCCHGRCHLGPELMVMPSPLKLADAVAIATGWSTAVSPTDGFYSPKLRSPPLLITAAVTIATCKLKCFIAVAQMAVTALYCWSHHGFCQTRWLLLLLSLPVAIFAAFLSPPVDCGCFVNTGSSCVIFSTTCYCCLCHCQLLVATSWL